VISGEARMVLAACHRRAMRYIRRGMKMTTLSAAAVAGLLFGSVSCERHSWDETKALHEKHGHGGHEEHAEHKDGEHHEDEAKGPEAEKAH
jgi:hypothetical protein